jgi:hypothetical protein
VFPTGVRAATRPEGVDGVTARVTDRVVLVGEGEAGATPVPVGLPGAGETALADAGVGRCGAEPGCDVAGTTGAPSAAATVDVAVPWRTAEKHGIGVGKKQSKAPNNYSYHHTQTHSPCF